MDKESFFEKRRFLITIVAPLLPNIVGSVFNIWYNLTNIQPLLTENQLGRFLRIVNVYNAIVYPVLVTGLVFWILAAKPVIEKLRRGESVDSIQLKKTQKRVINIPWGFVTIGCLGWFMCIPVFQYMMSNAAEPLHPHVLVHLPISFIIAGLIAITQSLFIAELCSLRLLYPLCFPEGKAAETRGAYTLGLIGKGLIWAIAAVVCPIVSLLMLLLAPVETQGVEWFTTYAIAVGVVSILFGLLSAYLIGRLVSEPVHQLLAASQRVGAGDLTARVDVTRADDFGPLIDEFNAMVSGLKEKQVIQETFGRHVGEQAAREILAQDGELSGKQKTISVMFVDLRNYTAQSANLDPSAVVKMLNLFLSEMVEIVEQNNGMVNKFLGDGFMALFGAAQVIEGHATDAVRAGQEMLERMELINQKIRASDLESNLSIGIGIHTGPAIVGSIGSKRRQEYTAIGDTVNVASRVESLTKQLGELLLITSSTRSQLSDTFELKEMPPQAVKGKADPIVVFSVI